MGRWASSRPAGTASSHCRQVGLSRRPPARLPLGLPAGEGTSTSSAGCSGGRRLRVSSSLSAEAARRADTGGLGKEGMGDSTSWPCSESKKAAHS